MSETISEGMKATRVVRHNLRFNLIQMKIERFRSSSSFFFCSTFRQVI